METISNENRPPFKLAGTAAIKHLNVRKEGPEDEQILAVDIKLEMKKLDRVLCDYFDPALQTFLWRGDTDSMIVRNNFLQPVAYMHTISSAIATIDLHIFQGAEIKKFTIQPKDGGVIDLICSVTVYPSASEVADLAKRVQDDVRVAIDGPPDLFASATSQDKDASDGTQNPDGDGVDQLIDRTRSLVIESNKASISYIQRKLQIGYNRAARLLEALEIEGVVGPMGASGMRQVLAQQEAAPT